MLKKVFSLLVCFCLVMPLFTVFVSGAEPSVSAKSAIVMNALTGEVVFSKNPYEKMGIASTTKIMTSLIALESKKINKVVKAQKEDIAVEGTSIYLKEGDKLTVETLVKGMLLESGNDAANVTAQALGGGKEGFASLMNQRARELGMLSTNFKNPSGLTEDGHYSTAYDMALLGSAAIRNKSFREICSATSLKVDFVEPKAERTFYNHNKFLSKYDGALGIKTGFTKASGRCLVTAAQRNGVIYVAVTLNAPDDWNDHVKMMDFAFDNTTVSYPECDLSEVEVAVVGSDLSALKVEIATPLQIHSVKPYEDYEFVVYLPRFVYAGVKQGEISGRVDLVSKNGAVIDSSALVFTTDAPEKVLENNKNTGFFKKLINKITEGLSQRQT